MTEALDTFMTEKAPSYEDLKERGEAAAKAFNVSAPEILGFKYYEFANAVKFSIRRPDDRVCGPPQRGCPRVRNSRFGAPV